MALLQRITDREYEDLALREPDKLWELWDGVLRERPGMSWKHNRVQFRLGYLLQLQIDRLHPGSYAVGLSGARTRLPNGDSYVPDVVVVPSAYDAPYEDTPFALEAYADPLPLVVEVWSPSTGHYDVEVKLRGYQARGDLEIWRIHPFERTLTAWRRQPDGSYEEAVYRAGIVPVASLPGVAIDLDALLDG